MTLPELTARAKKIRALYAAQSRRQGSRPWAAAELAQGLVGDIGDLMKLVMAKQGLRPAKNLDAALAHELADCLWSVLLLADAYNIDLERSFLTTMSALERKLTAPHRTKPAERATRLRDTQGRNARASLRKSASASQRAK